MKENKPNGHNEYKELIPDGYYVYVEGKEERLILIDGEMAFEVAQGPFIEDYIPGNKLAGPVYPKEAKID